MALEKINFSYPKGSLQSVFDGDAVTALELAALNSKKVDECVDIVNGVEQTAIEATAIVDDMQIQQQQFLADNADTRSQLITDNQLYLDGLTASKTQFEADLNTSKTTFETNMTNAVTTIIENAETSIETDVNTKIDALINDGTIPNLINVDTEKSIVEATGQGVIYGLSVAQQTNPDMSVLIFPGVAHLYNGKRYEQLDNKTIVIDVADASYNRIDIIYINSLGVLSYGKGNPSAAPTPPQPVNGLVLAEVSVSTSTVMITALKITDRRLLKYTTSGIRADVGELEDLQTEVKTSIVGAINSYVGRKTDVTKYGAKGDGIADDTLAINNAIIEIDSKGGGSLFFPNGTYKITSTINLKTSVKISGESKYLTIIKAFNCDAFTIQPEWGTAIEKMSIYSVDANGAWYPKLKTGIKCNGSGVAPLAVNRNLFSELDIKGFNVAIDLRYTWDTNIEKIETLDCNYGVNLWGLSVNNTISDSFIKVDNVAGSAAIRTQKDGAVNGEGLMITNCLLASGEYGIYSDDFLSINISNCIIDLFSKNAIRCQSVKAFTLTNSYCYSAGDVINVPNLGALENQFSKVTGCTLISTAGTNGIYLGALNQNWIFANNTIKALNTCFYIEAGAECSIIGNIFESLNKSTYPIFLNGKNCVIVNNKGDCSVQHYSTAGRNSVMNNNGDPIIVQGSLNSVPTSGSWKRGDIILYWYLEAGRPIGCVCVDGGTPGTWLEFGTVGMTKMTAQANSVATDVAGLVTDFNNLLSKLRTSNHLTI